MIRRMKAYDEQIALDLDDLQSLHVLANLLQFHHHYPLHQHGIDHPLLGYYQYSHRKQAFPEFETMLQKLTYLPLDLFLLAFQFLLGRNLDPTDNELDQKAQLE